MDDSKIITVYCIKDDVMAKLGYHNHSHTLAQVSDAEVLAVAVVPAMHFQNHHKGALQMMEKLRYITKPLSVSRFNR
ncbi:MAG TPA: IS982 family transposase, partial [Chloroflexia bacterium]|nr:IS982 family transposase [Chloroflexia bacterium]